MDLVSPKISCRYIDMEIKKDPPSSTPRRRGRPPKTASSSEIVKSQSSGDNSCCHSRQPNSANKGEQNGSVRDPDENFHSSLSTPTMNTSNAMDATPTILGGRRSSRTPKPVVEKDFITPTSSRKSLGKQGQLDRDSHAQSRKSSCDKTSSSSKASYNEDIKPLADSCSKSESRIQTNPSRGSMESQQHFDGFRGLRKDRQSTQIAAKSIESDTEDPEESSDCEQFDNSLTKLNKIVSERRRSKTTGIEGGNDNVENETEITEDTAESLPTDGVPNSNKRKRGRPRKQSLEAKSGPLDTSMVETHEDMGEADMTEGTAESLQTDGVPNSNKKKRGRPHKQSLEAKSGPLDTSMATEDMGETEVTDDTAESLQTDWVSNSSKRKRGRPRKQSLETKSGNLDNSMATEDMGETEMTEDVAESLQTDGVPNFNKKKRGRPSKQSLEAKSGNLDSSMATEDMGETEMTEDTAESLQTDVVPNSNKKKRGRPSKQSLEAKSGNLDNSVNTPEGKIYPATESATPIQSQKRRRAPNQKYAEDDSVNRRRLSLDTPKQTLSNKRRGRPPRSAKSENKVYVEDDQDSEEEFEMKSDSDREDEVVFEKNKRGRKRKQVKDTSDSDVEPTPKRKKSGSKQHSQGGKQNPPKVTIRKCVLCGEELKDLPAIKRHMMVAHSLVYTKENPEGVSNSYLIVRVLGYVDCQKCSKRFRGAQYYNYHTIWCGREEEAGWCEICNKEIKAMWLQQHLTNHRTTQRKLEREKEEEAERARRRLEEKGEESEGEEEGAGEKKKRKAAKSALKYLSQAKDGDKGGGKEGSDNESYKDSGRESESDEDDGEESDASADEDGSSNFRYRRRRLAEYKTLLRSLWRKPNKSNLHELQEYHSDQPQLQLLFPDLQPLREEWKPLNSREKMKYLPDPGGCVNVCTSTKEAQSSELKQEEGDTTQHTLSFGQTCLNEGSGNSISFTGAPIRALEWCPLPSDTSSEQVVAVAVDELKTSTTSYKALAGPGLVQLWSTQGWNQEDARERSAEDASNQKVTLRCCLAHDAGRVRSMAWCPWRLSEQDQQPPADGCLQRLGLLALACSNGTVQVFSVPQLQSLPPAPPAPPVDSEGGSFCSTAVVKPKPTLSLELNSKPGYCGQCLTVAWQQGGQFRYIAAGYGTGTIVIWDLQNTSPLLQTSRPVIRPLRCFLSHTAPVVSVAFCPQLPHLLASSAQDYTLCLTDISRPGALSADKRQIHPSIYRSLRWAGPIHLGLFCGEESLNMSNGCGLNYAGLCELSMGRKCDAEFLIHDNASSTWDLDFCPYSSVAVTCDANGKVKAILLDMKKISTQRAKSKSFESYKLMFCPAALVYQIRKGRERIPTDDAVPEPESDLLKPVPESVLSETLLHSKSKEIRDIQVDNQHSSSPPSPNTLSVPTAASNNRSGKASVCLANQVEAISDEHGAALRNEKCQESERVASKHSSETSCIDKSMFSQSARLDVQSQGEHSNSPTNLRDVAGVKSLPSANQTLSSNKTKDGMKQSSAIHRSDETSLKTFGASTNVMNGHCENGQQNHTEEPGEETRIKESTYERTRLNLNELTETFHYEGFKEVEFEDLRSAKQATALEDLTNPNNQLAYRVRLNPNPEHCALLASGGLSGLLRIDDLSHILESHRPSIEKLRSKAQS